MHFLCYFVVLLMCSRSAGGSDTDQSREIAAGFGSGAHYCGPRSDTFRPGLTPLSHSQPVHAKNDDDKDICNDSNVSLHSYKNDKWLFYA